MLGLSVLLGLVGLFHLARRSEAVEGMLMIGEIDSRRALLQACLRLSALACADRGGRGYGGVVSRIGRGRGAGSSSPRTMFTSTTTRKI